MELQGFRLLLMLSLTQHCSAIETANVVDFCGQTIRGDGMIVNSHLESKKYYFVTMGTDCHLTMQASSPKDKVQFHFRFFLVYSLLRVAPLSPAPVFPESPWGSASLNPRLESTSGEGSSDPCHAGSYVQFYDGRDRSSPSLGPPLCGKSPPRPVLSTGNYLTLRLVTRGTQPRVDFVGDFTSFRLGFNQSECSGEPYFNCRNGKCIPLSLVCDDKGIDNCGDGSDLEENLTTGCKAGQLLPPEPPAEDVSPPPPTADAPTVPPPLHMNCDTQESTPGHVSTTGQWPLKSTLPLNYLSYDGYPTVDWRLIQCLDLQAIQWTDESHHSTQNLKLRAKIYSSTALSLLILYILLGVVAGSLVLCWCCWSPGWFLWRVGICRFMSCCNSACASCHLCARSCTQSKDHRLAKVSPHTLVNRTSACATEHGVDQNVTLSTV